MKNIHLVLAGESRLSLNRSYRDYAIGTEAGEPYWTYSQYKHHMSVTDASVRPHNMYITSDEEIKEGDWYLDTFNTQRIKANQFSDHKHYGNACKKIILTTDQDLIKDGVWGIEDGFLEWFVKNPSCEYVNIEKYHGINTSIAEVNYISGDGSLSWQGRSDLRDYKIIIPKEEAKQETLEEAAERTNPVIIRSTPFGSKYEWVPKKERKQFVEGAKWQQEQDKNNYSEVFEWLANKDYLSDKVELIQKEFEEFKKK
jgi:hypothetical protein